MAGNPSWSRAKGTGHSRFAHSTSRIEEDDDSGLVICISFLILLLGCIGVMFLYWTCRSRKRVRRNAGRPKRSALVQPRSVPRVLSWRRLLTFGVRWKDGFRCPSTAPRGKDLIALHSAHVRQQPRDAGCGHRGSAGANGPQDHPDHPSLRAPRAATSIGGSPKAMRY